MRFHRHRPDTSALRLIGLDNTFSQGQLAALAAHTDVITVPAGQVLARAGTVARQFIAVVDGDVTITDSHGRTRVAGPGWQLGAAELTQGRDHATTVVTSSASTLVVIYGPAFTAAARSSRRGEQRRTTSQAGRADHVTTTFAPWAPAVAGLNGQLTMQRSA